MQWTAKVDKSNRITLPKAMREELGIHPGDEFDFYVDGQKLFVVRRTDRLTFSLIVLPAEAA